jgi:molybdopterin-guanine dinucleotide biosynthesis protein A
MGAVLAGGQSQRFGSDKAAATLGGKTLVERAAETLACVFDEVVVVSSRDTPAGGWTRVADLRPGEGPLAGIEAALRYATERGLEGAFVLACDLPLVDAGTVRAIVAAVGNGCAAAPRREGEPGWEPLCAAYRVECLARASDALDREERSAQVVLDRVAAAPVKVPGALLLNVNTPADHSRAVSVLEE